MVDYLTDSSGLVRVGIFKNENSTERQHNTEVAAGVDQSMLAIGGGATVRASGPGALLTASYPSQGMASWLASSKDHLYADCHRLDVFSLGLSILGMTREELYENIRVEIKTSSEAAHPDATAHLPSDYLLIGGGFKVNWRDFGNLATASFPSSKRSWTVRSKDHLRSSPCNVTAFAIGIRENLKVGVVQTHIQRAISVHSSLPCAFANVAPGFVLTGGGAETVWKDAGTMLWKMEPSVFGYEAYAKDHGTQDMGTISVYSIAMRIASPY